MKLWSRKDNLNKMIENFTVGNDRQYDMYLAKYDVLASKAHVKMLHKIRLLNDLEKKSLILFNKNFLSSINFILVKF